MAILQLPVRNDTPAYQFRMTLQSRIYTFSFRFNTRTETWSMDVADESQTPVFQGIPLLTGILLTNGLVNSLKPPGEFILIDESGKNRNPDRETLGKDVKLLYVEVL